MSDTTNNQQNAASDVCLSNPASWPVISPVDVIMATEPAVQRGIIAPMLTTVGLMSARLMMYRDDRADALYPKDQITATRERRELAAFAREVTGYFAANISCFTIAQTFAADEVDAAKRDLLHGVTVACKHAPDLLQDSAVASAVAMGFEDYPGMTPDARQDQAALIDNLIIKLTHDEFGDVPAHMETLAHQMDKWGREDIAARQAKALVAAAGDAPEEEIKGPPPGARAQALSRIILNRIGVTDADAENILTNGEYGRARPAVA